MQDRQNSCGSVKLMGLSDRSFCRMTFIDHNVNQNSHWTGAEKINYQTRWSNRQENIQIITKQKLQYNFETHDCLALTSEPTSKNEETVVVLC